MKKLYLGTICFLPPLFAVLLPVVFLVRLPFRFPVGVFPYLIGYFWIGLIVLLVDLWRSPLDPDRKVLWTVLNVFLGLVTLPIYWFQFVKKAPMQTPETARGK